MIEKKEWKKPALLVLVRGRPEEAILDACNTESGGGPMDIWDVCGWKATESCYCWCAASGAS